MAQTTKNIRDCFKMAQNEIANSMKLAATKCAIKKKKSKTYSIHLSFHKINKTTRLALPHVI